MPVFGHGRGGLWVHHLRAKRAVLAKHTRNIGGGESRVVDFPWTPGEPKESWYVDVGGLSDLTDLNSMAFGGFRRVNSQTHPSGFSADSTSQAIVTQTAPEASGVVLQDPETWRLTAELGTLRIRKPAAFWVSRTSSVIT